MPSFELKVSPTELPNILNSMREWLDHRKSPISHFRSESDDATGTVTIKVGFTLADDAEAFGKTFNHRATPVSGRTTDDGDGAARPD